MMEIQIFGTKKSPATRRAQRFFAERRIKVHFVDLAQRAASPGELRRFVQKFGTDTLIDRDAKRFAELGLTHASYGSDRWLEILAEEPLLLRQPLVRNGAQLTIGDASSTWKEWAGR
jgi:arsenate reductase-like glutaredoxin family protein